MSLATTGQLQAFESRFACEDLLHACLGCKMALASHCKGSPVGCGQGSANVLSAPGWRRASPRCTLVAHCSAGLKSYPGYKPAVQQKTSVCGSFVQPRLANRCQRGLGPTVLATAGSLGSSSDAAASEALQEGLASLPTFAQALWKFSRPHTLFGTFVSVCSVSLLAVSPGDPGGVAAVALLQALVPALLMNVCIVGINQVYDIEIDKVNKPYLPLASGELTMQQGQSISAAAGAAALLIGGIVGSLPLTATLVGSLLLGIAYSTDLPFLRWKRFPLVAASCILAVRAVMVQLGFYFHMKRALGVTALVFSRPLLFAVGFMLFVSIVIALFKDIPDIKGDDQAGVRTMSVRLGPHKVFWTCIALLEVAYAGAIAVGLSSPVWWSKLSSVATHAFMASLLLWRARQTDLQNSKSIYSCYMFVWKLFYAEYILLPLFR